MKFQTEQVGWIIWGQYWLTKSSNLLSDHGGHTRNWFSNIKWKSSGNFNVIDTSSFCLGMWGSFGVSIDLPKLEDSDLTMEATLKTDPEMEVTPKLLGYWGLKLLAWHVRIIWGQYWFAKTRGHSSHHGGHTWNWSWNGGHSKTYKLLRPQTSSLACGDHLGSVLICQN